MNNRSKIYVAGHTGLVGCAILGALKTKGYTNVVVRSHKDLDLTRQKDVEDFFVKEMPENVFLCAAKVGGILANNTYPAEFIYENLMISTNIINASYKYGVKKLINLGSSCIYPKVVPQPIREEYLLSGKLEHTNEAYSIAKIAAVKLCRYYNDQYSTNFISLMPANLYGPNDNFNLQTSHVLPALIRKFYAAKTHNYSSVNVWGTGTPEREFLYVNDLAEACVYIMENYDAKEVGELLNIGTGKGITIKELADIISNTVGYNRKIEWDPSKPDGTPQRVLDISIITKMGWKPKISLKEGIKKTYQWYLDSI